MFNKSCRNCFHHIATCLVICLSLLIASCSPGTAPLPASQESTPTLETILPQPSASPTLTSSSIPAQIDTPVPSSTATPKPLTSATMLDALPTGNLIHYTVMAGDLLSPLAARFGVSPEEITSTDPLPQNKYLSPGQKLLIPDILKETGPPELLLPDSEIINSPSTVGFNIKDFVSSKHGYLSTYREYFPAGWKSGAEIIQTVAEEYSINPRLLLSILDYQSQWVTGKPDTRDKLDYPLGWKSSDRRGLWRQLNWAATQIMVGYYGWRDASQLNLTFPNGASLRFSPGLNAGTVSVQYLFSKMYNLHQWYTTFHGESSLIIIHTKLFGDVGERSKKVEPLFLSDISQPPLTLPFIPGHIWNYTCGPHPAWSSEGVLAALDFAPSGVANCTLSKDWITAPANGIVVRSGNGTLVLDLDGDGNEQTGWTILFLHIAAKDRVSIGTRVKLNDHLGHPSCEGGYTSGTHIHIARKYNGEWIPADSPAPFVMGGWRAYNGAEPYQGILKNGDQIIIANRFGMTESIIIREEGEK
jgi:LasA protease